MVRAIASVAVVVLALLVSGCAPSRGEGDRDQQLPPPREQWASDMEECMSARGWNVAAAPGGAIDHWGVPEDQLEQFDADLEDCQSEYGYDIPRPPITADEAGEIWDEMLATADCIRGLGYDVPEPPSREFAIEALQQEPIDLGWAPHYGVPSRELDEVMTECPGPIL